jgi:hypothetical protein
MIFKFFITTALILCFGSEVNAQTHLSYGDTNGPFIDFTTDSTISNSPGDSLVISAFGERFDLPTGMEILDSVDFIIDSFGTDSISIDIVPAIASQTNNGSELLPDFSNPNVNKTFHFYKESIHGSRASVSCGKIMVDNTFFILLANAFGSVTYRANKQTANVNLDTARSVYVAADTESFPFPIFTKLVDGNLMPVGVNVDMDIGITYENAEGVQVHLSPSSVTTTVYPNPAPIGNPIQLSGADSVISAEVMDEAGRIVRNYHVGASNSLTELPTQGLSSGVYNVVLFHSDGSATSVKFVVE